MNSWFLKLPTALMIATIAGCFPLTARQSTSWFTADSLPLLGKCVDPASTSLRYQRLPDSLEHTGTRPPLFYNGRHSSGMAIRFATDAPSIDVKWTSVIMNRLEQMTPTAVRGLDLYMMLPDSSWTFINTARPDLYKPSSQANLFNNFEPIEREYMLYLSLYDCVDSLAIGVPQGYSVRQPSIGLPVAHKPIVYYGTSLVHGGCVNRAGMSPSNILRRRLNRDIVNLGFGGNGQLDLEIARVIAAAHDPSLIILDFVANCSSEQIDTLMVPFVDIIREAHPQVPILFIECLHHPRTVFDTKLRNDVETHNAIMHSRYDDLCKRYAKLYYLPADNLIEGNDHTVDALHFTDYGAMLFANALQPTISSLLEE